MSINSIIFDFDGTLFDSMSIWETAGVDYLSSIGYITEEGLSKRIKSMSLLQAAVYLKEQYTLAFSVEEIMAGINKTVEDYYFHKVMPKACVISLLSSLKKKNIKMCIATATDRYQIEAALKRCGILNY